MFFTIDDKAFQAAVALETANLSPRIEAWVVRGATIVNAHLTVRNPGTPMGSIATGKRRATSPHPGRLRGSWFWTSGNSYATEKPGLQPTYKIPDDLTVKNDLSSFRLGEDIRAANNQDYAPVINAGRLRNKRGWMSGSEQAPEGILIPAIAASETEINQLPIPEAA